MKINFKTLIVLLLSVALISSTTFSAKAEGEVLLASVDWVNSQLNELKNTINDLNTKIDNMNTNTTNNTNASQTNLSYIDKLPLYVFVKNDMISINSDANTKSSVVGEKSKGNSIRVLSSIENEYGKWYRVVYNDSNNGWLQVENVQLAPVSGFTTVVPNKNTYIYKRATTTYDISTSVKSGSTLKYLGTFQNPEGEIWFDVRTSNGIRGWLLSNEGVLK